MMMRTMLSLRLNYRGSKRLSPLALVLILDSISSGLTDITFLRRTVETVFVVVLSQPRFIRRN